MVTSQKTKNYVYVILADQQPVPRGVDEMPYISVLANLGCVVFLNISLSITQTLQIMTKTHILLKR